MNFIRVALAQREKFRWMDANLIPPSAEELDEQWADWQRSGRWVAEGIDEFHLCRLSLAWVWYLPLHTSWTRVKQIDEIWSSRCRWHRCISSFFVRTCIVNQEQIPRLCLFLGVLQTRSSTTPRRRRRDEAGRVGVREGGVGGGDVIGRDLKVGLFLVEKGKQTNKQTKQTNKPGSFSSSSTCCLFPV